MSSPRLVRSPLHSRGPLLLYRWAFQQRPIVGIVFERRRRHFGRSSRLFARTSARCGTPTTKTARFHSLSLYILFRLVLRAADVDTLVSTTKRMQAQQQQQQQPSFKLSLAMANKYAHLTMKQKPYVSADVDLSEIMSQFTTIHFLDVVVVTGRYSIPLLSPLEQSDPPRLSSG